MADVSTLRTQDELDLINRSLGSAYLEEDSFKLSTSAVRIDARRRENVKVLESLGSFCETREIRWFVYGDTLRGVVSYEDFLPGSYRIDFGMLRPEFEKFEEAVAALSESERDELPWEYRPCFEGTSVRRIYPHVCAKSACDAKRDGKVVYDDEQLPIQVLGTVQITVFDEVPDDFFTRKKFYRQMKRRNTAFKKLISVRNLADGKEDGFQWVSKGAAILKLLPLRCASWAMHAKARHYEGRGTKMIARVCGWRSVTLPKEDIGETEWGTFAGVKVRCPVRPDIWAKEPVYETTPELKRLQDDAKYIVSEIDRVCHELGIGYFCCGGTMLGYVRHGGFIPWDDDIDVGMLREDYEKFKARAADLLDTDRLFLQTRESDPTIPYLFSKVRLKNSGYITEYNKFRHFQKGICVDVFPFDYVPNGRTEQIAFRSEVLEASKEHNHIVNRQYTAEQIAELPADRKDLDYHLAHAAGRILAHHYCGISLDKTQDAYDEIATRYDADHEQLGLQYVASFVPSYTMARVDDLFPTQRVQFDEIQVEIPKSPEIFLAMQYGDFMVMPYPHQRAGHDLLLWSDEQGIGGGREAENAEDTIQWG